MNKQSEENKVPCVLLGMSANALSVARSLGRKGVTVIGTDTSDDDEAMYCRYIKQRYILPDINEHEQEYLEKLLKIGKGLKTKAVLLAMADEHVVFISKYRKQLSEYFLFIISSPEVTEIFLNKEKSSEFAKANDIPHPYTHQITNEDQINELADTLEYPCIIKPQDSHIWRLTFKEQKVIIVNSADELRKEYAKIKKYKLNIIIQQIVVGPDSNMLQYYAYRNNEGKIQAEFCGHKLRQYPPNFGVGCLTKSESNETVAKLGRKIMNDADYRGLASIAIKLDERNNNPYFLESNIRYPLTSQLSITSGIDHPYINYRNLAYGDNLIGTDCVQQDDVNLLNLKLDIGHYFRNKELSFIEWLKVLKAKKYAHTYFAWDDPVPSLVVYSKLVVVAFKKLFKSLFGKKSGSDESD